MTHASVDPEDRVKLGITDTLVSVIKSILRANTSIVCPLEPERAADWPV